MHEGLVVEAGDEDLRQDVVDRTHVGLDIGPGVLAVCRQTFVDLDLGGAQVRLGAVAALKLDQRVWLFRTGGENAARTVILEAAGDQMDAVGEQGRGEGIAGIALERTAVEGEVDRAAPVDPATGRGAEFSLAHDRLPCFSAVAGSATGAVSVDSVAPPIG